jgi:hypothetical protein
MIVPCESPLAYPLQFLISVRVHLSLANKNRCCAPPRRKQCVVYFASFALSILSFAVILFRYFDTVGVDSGLFHSGLYGTGNHLIDLLLLVLAAIFVTLYRVTWQAHPRGRKYHTVWR